MTYETLIEDIVKRVDANLVTEYTARAQTLFLSAVAQLAVSDNVDEYDMPELISVETLDFSGCATQLCGIKILGSSSDLSGTGVIKVLDVYERPTSSNAVVYSKKTLGYIKSLSTNDELQPDTNEIIYYKAGNSLYFYNPTVDFSEYEPTIIYVQSPTPWNDGDEMTEKYSQKFLQQASDITAKNLYNEITT